MGIFRSIQLEDRRAYFICTEESDLKDEIALLIKVFKDINGYPQRIIEKCHNKIKGEVSKSKETTKATTTTITTTTPTTTETATAIASATTTKAITEDEKDEARQPLIVIPYAGRQGEKVLNKLK